MLTFAHNILAETINDLENTLKITQVVLGTYDVKIALKKRKVMRRTKFESRKKINMKLGPVHVRIVGSRKIFKQFCYLGSKIRSENWSNQDIRNKAGQAIKTKNRMVGHVLRHEDYQSHRGVTGEQGKTKVQGGAEKTHGF